jgi:hypothetical protein
MWYNIGMKYILLISLLSSVTYAVEKNIFTMENSVIFKGKGQFVEKQILDLKKFNETEDENDKTIFEGVYEKNVSLVLKNVQFNCLIRTNVKSESKPKSQIAVGVGTRSAELFKRDNAFGVTLKKDSTDVHLLCLPKTPEKIAVTLSDLNAALLEVKMTLTGMIPGTSSDLKEIKHIPSSSPSKSKTKIQI